MMLVVFRILFINLEIILRYVHKFCSLENIPDPGNLANRPK